MPINAKIYDKKFFANTLKFESQSAQAFVKILIKHFAPKSVIDIGCGSGIYLTEFAKNNVDILGCEGSPAAVTSSSVGNKIKLHDLCQPLELNRQFDLCLCLEVAEHLDESCADTLIGALTGLASTIVFTAATPGQGPKSLGHINEQPPEYWQEKFKRKNFILNENLTEIIKQEMAAQNIVWWLVKNLMIYEKQ